MKFLCVDCNEAMKLTSAGGPDNGSMTVLFLCPSCKRQIAMLTNAMETQMVRSLGVKIGTQSGAAAPMETIRSALAGAADEAAEASDLGDEGNEARCPFGAVVDDAHAAGGSAAKLVWTSEAEARMARIPSYVRGMVKRGVEDHARRHGLSVVTAEVLDAARSGFGM